MKYLLLASLLAFWGYVLASKDAPPSETEKRNIEASPPPKLSDGDDVNFPGTPFPYPGAVGV